MIRSKTRWTVASLDAAGEEQAVNLARELSLSALVARLLVQRGFGEVDKARRFLHGGAEGLYDPFQLKGMKEAVMRIRLAQERREMIRIFGDYDADGVSSTALMTFLFRRMGLIFDSYIPHRTLEGYGLNINAIDLAAEAGVKLIVTVDTGVSAVDQIAHANELGIDVIVTDHHEPPHTLPDALALINPKQEDCPYPFKGLAGVGVAFKLAQALLGEPPLEWCDVVALGTIADLMPLTDENRVLVRLGLEELRKGDKPGFRALAEVTGIKLAQMNSTGIGFGMAPRINAAGRLDHAKRALDLLTSSDDETAAESAFMLDTLNRERQLVVETIVKEAEKQWLDKCLACAESGIKEPSVIVLAAEGWNVGVVGIVASKMIEKCYKPTLILSIDKESGQCKGSARSIAGFDLHAALTECEALLDHYGGHQAAAGMSLHVDHLQQLEASLGRLADEWLTDDDWIPGTIIDLECRLSDASLEVLEQLEKLEPFGNGNTSPKLLLQGAALADRRTMGKENKHLKLSLRGDGKLLDAVGFGFGSLSDKLSDGADLELVGELSINEWNGQRRVQFMVGDLRVPHIQLFDRRDAAGSDSLTSLQKLIRKEEADTVLVLVPSPVWLDAARNSETFALLEEIRMVTYEEAATEEQTCTKLVLLGRPPSTDKLAAVLRFCPGIEALYAMYGESSYPVDKSEKPRAASRQDNQKHTSEAPLSRTDRKHFGHLYQTLRRVCPIQEEGAAERLAVMMGWKKETVSFMFSVFLELELIVANGNELELPANPVKKELIHSQAYREAQRREETEQILFADTQTFAGWINQQMDKTQTLTSQRGVEIS
ncbi:single-stranded-DNA-specific exonuclease RecJ [Paenibacillus nasutitermitis]|uniref:Single-stranded-DNA-specific exonuclease RecJ n=1 Tax=Paenibacillus nasutitermitis TaxID=1652958 RepID=A0A917DNT7_9BACL|nr:single-stranded-DNA-specific exonuclease RecJ [Paenibacillus nasutitermitis]GGD54856.1 single-stranded-DNA-specific exonuclease RecJ [Paenibacillus nasutitermitis]